MKIKFKQNKTKSDVRIITQKKINDVRRTKRKQFQNKKGKRFRFVRNPFKNYLKKLLYHFRWNLLRFNILRYSKRKFKKSHFLVPRLPSGEFLFRILPKKKKTVFLNYFGKHYRKLLLNAKSWPKMPHIKDFVAKQIGGLIEAIETTPLCRSNQLSIIANRKFSQKHIIQSVGVDKAKHKLRPKNIKGHFRRILDRRKDKSMSTQCLRKSPLYGGLSIVVPIRQFLFNTVVIKKNYRSIYENIYKDVSITKRWEYKCGRKNRKREVMNFKNLMKLRRKIHRLLMPPLKYCKIRTILEFLFRIRRTRARRKRIRKEIKFERKLETSGSAKRRVLLKRYQKYIRKFLKKIQHIRFHGAMTILHVLRNKFKKQTSQTSFDNILTKLIFSISWLFKIDYTNTIKLIAITLHLTCFSMFKVVAKRAYRFPRRVHSPIETQFRAVAEQYCEGIKKNIKFNPSRDNTIFSNLLREVVFKTCRIHSRDSFVTIEVNKHYGLVKDEYVVKKAKARAMIAERKWKRGLIKKIDKTPEKWLEEERERQKPNRKKRYPD